MFRPHSCAFWILIAEICVAPGWSVSPASAAAKPIQGVASGKVSGQVLSDGGHPIRGAQVYLHGTGPETQGVSRYGITNREGRFSFRKIAPGSYALRAMQRGYFSMQQEDGTDYVKVTVSEGQEIKDLDLRLARGGAITGRLTDEDGEPLVGSRIRVLRKNSNGDAYDITGVETDDRGVYRAFGLQEGDYLLFASIQSMEEGHTSNSAMYYPGVRSQKEAEAIHVSPGDEVSDINFDVKEAKGLTVSGRVINAMNGSGIADAVVRLYGNNVSLSVETDEEGKYEFSGLSAGPLTIQAEIPQQSFLPSHRSLKLDGANLLNQDLLLEVGGEIRGKLVLEGGRKLENPQGIAVQARILADPPEDRFERGRLSIVSSFSAASDVFARLVEDYTFVQSGNVKPDGSFAIRGLRSGRVRLVALPSSSRYYLKQIQLGTKTIGNAPLPLAPGEIREDVSIVLSDDVGAVRGTLQSAAANGGRYSVTLLPADRGKWSDPSAYRQTVVMAGGQSQMPFSIPDVPVGQYYVLALPGQMISMRLEDISQAVQSAAVVTVRSSETAAVTVSPVKVPER